MSEMKFKAYLLGTATESERAAIDRKLLTDDDEFEQVLLAEDDLIEAYLRQALSAVERSQFEQFFLADPERQQKLRLAKALHRYANDASKSSPAKVTTAATAADSWWAVLRRPVWQWATACVLLVVALLGIKAVFNPAEPIEIVQSSPSPITAIAPTTVPMGVVVLPVELFPGQTRDVGTKLKEVLISSDHGTVQFTLHLRNAPYPSYEVILEADDEAGQKLADQFKPQTAKAGNYLIVTVPVTMLGQGGYRIRLEGITPQGTEKAEGYSFTVKR